MHLFLTAFEDVPDPRAGNTRHVPGELLIIAFVSVLCGASSCAEICGSLQTHPGTSDAVRGAVTSSEP
jgi:hypothetical protein